MDKRSNTRGGGKFLSALCRILGTVVMIAVILVPLAVLGPRLFGLRAYHVTSGSMEPAIPTGSLVYVRAAQAETLEAGEVIAFSVRGSVVTHRVLENDAAARELITKGDANDREDLTPIPYNALIGRVAVTVPRLGALASSLTTLYGKIFLAAALAVGFLLQLLGTQLAPREEE